MICVCGSITMRGGGGVVSYRATVLNAEDLQLWHRPRCPQRLQQVRLRRICDRRKLPDTPQAARVSYARIGCEGQRSQVERFVDSKEGHREGKGGPAAVIYGLGKKIRVGRGLRRQWRTRRISIERPTMRWVRIRDATKNSGVASGPFAVEDKGEKMMLPLCSCRHDLTPRVNIEEGRYAVRHCGLSTTAPDILAARSGAVGGVRMIMFGRGIKEAEGTVKVLAIFVCTNAVV